MKKLTACVAALGVVIGLSGCGSLSASAATVNGIRISTKTVDDEMVQIGNNKDYRDAIQLNDVQGTGGKKTFKAAFAAQVLTRQIYYLLVHREVERRHITLTSGDLADARKVVIAQISTNPQTGEVTKGAGDKILAKFSKSYADEVVRREAEIERLQRALSVKVTDAQVSAYYDKHKDDFAQVCAMHVLVKTKQEADSVKSKLASGGDFAAIAQDQSIDPSARQNKGDLGCATPDSYVTEFADAIKKQQVGVVGDPVHTQFGWHVIKVYDRKVPALKDVSEQIRQEIAPQGQQALGKWLTETLDKAKVDVNPKYGVFDRSVGAGRLPRVDPPAAPGATTTTAP